MWDERYAIDEYVYGKEPNEFLSRSISVLPKGRTLCLAEGEGRNAVFLALHGHRVTAVDASAVGLRKADQLASEQGVTIRTETVDLAEYDPGTACWDAVVSIFCHLPAPVRKELHRKVVDSLVPGGVFILEGYTPDQLRLKTGGPPVEELMMSLADLKEELKGLTLEHAIETERDVIEGVLHTGRGAVVQIIARKPGRQQE